MQSMVNDAAETFTFVPADPPYVFGRVRLEDGSIVKEFRYYDLKVMVKALYGPKGANSALEEWVTHLASEAPETENVRPITASETSEPRNFRLVPCGES